MQQQEVEAEATGQTLAHGLRWGIKSSFIEYVRRMPDGKGAVGDGALPVGTSEIFFEYDAETTASLAADVPDRRVVAFRGTVTFTGHFGMLRVSIAQPHLEIDGDRAALTIADPDGHADRPRVSLATLTLQRVGADASTVVLGSDDVRLDAAAVPLFSDVYPAGEPLERLIAQLPAH